MQIQIGVFKEWKIKNTKYFHSLEYALLLKAERKNYLAYIQLKDLWTYYFGNFLNITTKHTDLYLYRPLLKW